MVPLFLITSGLACGFAHAADAPGSAAAEPAVDPKVLATLKTMGEHMRELKSFSVHADTTIDEVTEDGQKLQFGGTVDYKVRRPDHLRAEINSDRQERTFYYNGKTLTQWAPRMGYYAIVDAPPTLHELGDVLKDKFGISLPLSDLFRWGMDSDDGSGLTEASFVGPAKINGADCGHFAFRQPDVDWQLWLARGTYLPCKLVITTLDEPSQPQYVAEFSWKTNISFDDKTFTFEQPKTAHKIEIAVADASGH
ncbi:MAG TPA: DUF2092 domain-containing protein [Rhodanobacteraceae bacterium]|nr:DUF2092 domain-containing protein [Rhodanobacteraceae bacterium]